MSSLGGDTHYFCSHSNKPKLSHVAQEIVREPKKHNQDAIPGRREHGDQQPSLPHNTLKMFKIISVIHP